MYYNIDITFYWGCEMRVVARFKGVVENIIGWLIFFVNVSRFRLDSAKMGYGYSNLGVVVFVVN